MFNKILSTVSMAAVSAMVLIGGNVAATAATTTILTGNTAPGLVLNMNDVVYGGNSIDDFTTLDGAHQDVSGYANKLVASTPFTDTYYFNVQAGGVGVEFGINSDAPQPGSTASFGIANLQFNWNGGTWMDLTDATGSDIPGTTNVGVDNWYQGFLAQGQNILSVRGTPNVPGGSYNIKVSAIPLPPAALLFGTALFGIGALRRRKNKQAMDLAA